MGYLRSHQFQHALSLSLTLILGFIVSIFLNKPMGFWIVLTAFWIFPVTCGTTLRQSLLALFLIMLALIISLCVSIFIPTLIMDLLIIIIVFFVSSYAAYYQKPEDYYLHYIFFMSLLCSLFINKYFHIHQDELFFNVLEKNLANLGYVILGGAIGIFGSQFILPARMEKEFRLSLIPVLYAIRHYQDGIMNVFTKHEHNPTLLLGKRTQLEISLQSSYGYPNWVYEVGFNRGVRQGYRFFLIHLEQLCESVFASASLVSQHIDSDIINTMTSYLRMTTDKNNELIQILIHFFETESLASVDGEYMRDIIQLENALRRIMPGNLDLLEIMPDYLTLVAFVRTLKDMRERLLQLVNSVA